MLRSTEVFLWGGEFDELYYFHKDNKQQVGWYAELELCTANINL